MSNFIDAAKQILKMKNHPLHYKEITRFALEEGLISTTGLTPEATMNAIISSDIKKKGIASDFVKIERGLYALNENKIDYHLF